MYLWRIWGFTSLKFLQLKEIERYLKEWGGKDQPYPCRRVYRITALCVLVPLSPPQSLSPWELLFLLPTGVAILTVPPTFTSCCSWGCPQPPPHAHGGEFLSGFLMSPQEFCSLHSHISRNSHSVFLSAETPLGPTLQSPAQRGHWAMVGWSATGETVFFISD